MTTQFHFSKPLHVILASSLLFRAPGTQVALVRPDSRVHLQNVRPGRDLGNAVEIVSGLSPDDAVIDDPSDSITEGALVSVQQP